MKLSYSVRRTAPLHIILLAAAISALIPASLPARGSGESSDNGSVQDADQSAAHDDPDRSPTGERDEVSPGELVGARGQRFPPAPAVPDGPLNPETRAKLDELNAMVRAGGLPADVLAELGGAEDPRLLWYLSDLLRFSPAPTARAIYDVVTELTGVVLPRVRSSELRDHLFAWDLPVYPGYVSDKQNLYLLIEPRWEPFFTAEESVIDWRYVEWGGVLIDDRVDGSPGVPCERCIPALDDPPLTDAAGGAWYPDDALVFGVVINGEARAYPRNMMEVHEMVNDTLGGRRFGMPYCTLCLSAQAYYTDNVEGFSPLLRTSGLLARSNKFMYDLSTMSAIDTFTGEAISGPLLAAGVRLGMISVVTSTWEAWRRAYPDTTIIAQDGGIPGYRYSLDPLRGRDDDGPIFPVGAVDPRLPVQERVFGVIDADGTPVAFPVAATAFALQQGEIVTYGAIEVRLDGSGLRASVNGTDPGAHEAFWFAWSQFRPDTVIWQRE